MKIQIETLDKFYVIGISVKTTNENGRAGIDIPELWNKFISENLIDKIPNKIDNSLYCIYTEYEKDNTKPYTTILGCKVSNLDSIPSDMTGIAFNQEMYRKFTAKGNILQGVVFKEWTKIWNTKLNRKYSSDFEIYNEKSQDPENAEVDIFVSLN